MKPLTTFQIAFSNLRAKPWRTAALVFLVAVIVFSLYGGSVLSESLDNGMGSLEARLGADIAIVPRGSEDAYEDIILVGAGTLAEFHFDRDVEQQVAAIAGVEQVTPQFYLTSLPNMGCCTGSVRIIGIDFDTDFIVKPWIAHFFNRQIGDDEVIAGSNVYVTRDETVLFFGITLNVAARLERTATGMDNNVFVNMDTAREIARQAQEGGFAFNGVDIENSASAVMVIIDPDYDVTEVAIDILTSIPGVSLVTNNSIISGVSRSLYFFIEMIHTIMLGLVVLVLPVLACMFSMSANGRKKEFAILRILGATRKKLASIVLAEALLVSVTGAVFGSLLVMALVFPFGERMGTEMGMPVLLPSAIDSLTLFLFGFVLSVAVGPAASAYSAYKISRAETYATMREGE